MASLIRQRTCMQAVKLALSSPARCAAISPAAPVLPCRSAHSGTATATATATHTPSGAPPRTLTEEHLNKVMEKDAALRRSYDARPLDAATSVATPDACSHSPAQRVAFAQPGRVSGQADVTHRDAYVKRLVYRSKQRGWLEVDLLLGGWAATHLRTLSDAELQEYERILNLETLDLFNMLTLRMRPEELPKETDGGAPLAESKVLKRILEYCASSPLGRASPKAYEDVKKHMSN